MHQHFDSGGLKVEHFQKLNISYIKLHAGSVEKLFAEEKTARLLSAATEFAHALNIELILSEVKNADTEEKLKQLGAEYVQGRFYAPEQRFSEIYNKHVLGISPDPIQKAKASLAHKKSVPVLLFHDKLAPTFSAKEIMCEQDQKTKSR